jgi:hypothetical protein
MIRLTLNCDGNNETARGDGLLPDDQPAAVTLELLTERGGCLLTCPAAMRACEVIALLTSAAECLRSVALAKPAATLAAPAKGGA